MTTAAGMATRPLHYQIIGDQQIGDGKGPVWVFLHGWSSSGQEWLPFARALAERGQRALCWHAPGHPGGAAPVGDNSAVTLDAMADDLDALLHREAPQGAWVVAHSMGALTLWRRIQRHGDGQLLGAVMLDQSPKLITDPDWSLGIYGNFPAARNQAFIEAMEADFPSAVCRLMLGSLDEAVALENSASIERLQRYLSSLDPAPLIACWQSLADADLRSAIAQLRVPSLLVHGVRSQFYSAETGVWLLDQLPDARLCFYPDADHSPHLAHRQAFIEDLLNFQESVAAHAGAPRAGTTSQPARQSPC